MFVHFKMQITVFIYFEKKPKQGAIIQISFQKLYKTLKGHSFKDTYSGGLKASEASLSPEGSALEEGP